MQSKAKHEPYQIFWYAVCWKAQCQVWTNPAMVIQNINYHHHNCKLFRGRIANLITSQLQSDVHYWQTSDLIAFHPGWIKQWTHKYPTNLLAMQCSQLQATNRCCYECSLKFMQLITHLHHMCCRLLLTCKTTGALSF